MKKVIFPITFLLIVAVALTIFFLIPKTTTPNQEQNALAKTYVTQHIGELSPEQAVLGGHIYVTNIQVSDGTGVVSYEDGHIALTADFSYEVTGKDVVIKSFTVRH